MQHGSTDVKASYGVTIPNGVAGFKYYGYFQELAYRKIASYEDGNIKLGLHNIFSIPILKSMQIFDLDINLDAIASARLAGMLYKARGEVKNKTNNTKKESMKDRLNKLLYG